MSTKEEKTKPNNQNIKIYPPMTSLQTNDNNTISILSYNTLYKDWVNKERYPYIKNEQFRTWEYRLPRIRDIITKYNADIVCLQEIDIDPITFKKDFGDYFKNKLSYSYKLGLCSNIKPQHRKRDSDGHWGNAILYNSKRFKLLHSECLKKNSREMLSLFTDIKSIEQCSKCSINSSICCVYHSFFVINIHAPGHPNRWRSRLNTMQRILNKLKMFAHEYKTQKVEKKALKVNTNIFGKFQNMRIIICGDFNAPKTGNIDKLLLNKCIDVHHYNKTFNYYEWDKMKPNIETKDKKIIRFVVDSKSGGHIIGEKGVTIEDIRNNSKAGIWIIDASKGQYGLKNKKIISIKGSKDVILNAVNRIINFLLDEKIILLMEMQNIGLFDDLKEVNNILISEKTLNCSSEKMVEISGGINEIKTWINKIVERLFENEKCIFTERLYDPQVELDANYSHDFEFEDGYNTGLLCCCKEKECDLYYDRIKYFPTYGDGNAIGAMDFIYFTCNNMKLIGITKTLNDDELIRNVCKGIDEMKKCDDDKYKRQQGVLCNALELPNDKLVSDHLPIGIVIGLKSICEDNNDEVEKCGCFMQQKMTRVRNKINKNKKKKKKRNNLKKNEWVFYPMQSF
eukprot:210463_1